MTKKSKAFFNFEEYEDQLQKSDIRITRMIWFAAGFVTALVLIVIALFTNGH